MPGVPASGAAWPRPFSLKGSMKNLQEATERICELKGSLVALDALVPAVIDTFPESARARLVESFDAHAEVARTVMLHGDISDTVLTAFERDVASNRAVLRRSRRPDAAGTPTPTAAVALLLTTTRVTTFSGSRVLTSASGFFFRSGERLFLVSNRHVFSDAPGSHFPDRCEIEVHTDTHDLTRYEAVSLELYRDGRPCWREASDQGGAVDVAAIEVPAAQLPARAVLQAFVEGDLDAREEDIAVGDALTIVGFPLGFHDTVHHLAVARGASIASAFGVRFQRQGCFLTDARTHSGSSGSPVLRRRDDAGPAASPRSWQLLGVHSARMDMRTRDHAQDDALGLNSAWYADVLVGLTADGPTS